MKTKSKITKRILALFISVVMLLTACIPATAVSISAPDQTTPDSDVYYRVVYEDGMLRVKINPDKVYEVINDNKLTKEELLKFVPEDVLATIGSTGLTPEKLVTIVTNYISLDDLKSIIQDMPTEIVSAIIDVDLIESLIALDELLNSIPLDTMLSSVSFSEIETLFTDEVIDLMLKDTVINAVVDDAFVTDILNNTTIVDDLFADPTAKALLLDLLTDTVITEMINDPTVGPLLSDYMFSDEVVNALVADGTFLNSVLADATIIDRILAPGLISDLATIPSVLASLDVEEFYTGGYITINELKAVGAVDTSSIDFDYLKAKGIAVSDLITDNIINTSAVTSEQLQADGIITSSDLTYYEVSDISSITPALKEQIIEDKIVAGIIDNTYIEQKGLLNNANISAEYLMGKGLTIDVLISDGIVDASSSKVTALINNNYITPTEIRTVLGDTEIKNIITTNSDAKSKLVTYIKNNTALIPISDYLPHIDMSFMADKFSGDAAVAIGGYGVLVKFFDPMDIVDKIGTAKLMNYIDMEKVINDIGGYKTLFGYYSSAELKAIVEKIGFSNIMDFINNSNILSSVDVNAITNDIIAKIKANNPDLKAFAKEIGTRIYNILMVDVSQITLNGTTIFKVGKFNLDSIVYTVLKELPDIEDILAIGTNGKISSYELKLEMTSGTYAFAIETSFLGDPANLQGFLEQYRDNFKFDITEDLDITLATVANSVFTDVYDTLLTSTELTSAFKEGLLNLPAGNIEAIFDFINNISDSDLQAICDAVSPKLTTIKSNAYAAIDAIETFSADAAAKLKSKVDKIVNAFSSASELAAFRDEAMSELSAKTPAEIKALTLLDMYKSNGSFNFSRVFTIDLFEQIGKFISLPEEAKVLFEGNSMVLDGTLDTTLTVKDVYKLELVTETEGTLNFFLPAGISFDVLDNIPALADDLLAGIRDSSLSPVTVMPAEDVTLYTTQIYSVIFRVNGSPYATVYYPKGATSITAPIPPTAPAGYTSYWSPYTLNSAPTITSDLITKPNTYTLYYVDENGADLGGSFQFEFGTLNDGTILSNVPTKKGHTFASFDPYDLSVPGDITVTAKYTPNIYKITFVNTSGAPIGEFTYEYGSLTDLLILSKVPQKTGYGYTLSAYTLNADTNQTITVTYSPRRFTVTLIDSVTGNTLATLPYYYGTLTESMVKSKVPQKNGYSYTLSSFDINAASNQTVKVTYNANTYTITLKGTDGKVLATLDYTFGTLTADMITAKVPAKKGHTFALSSYDLGAYKDQDITVTYTPKQYKITIKDLEGNALDQQLTYAYGTKTEKEIHEMVLELIAERAGYSVLLSAFDEELDADQTITYSYKPNTYTFFFVDADDKVLAQFDFTYGSLTLAMIREKTPTKEGHTAELSKYDINSPSDITVEVTFVLNTYTVTFKVGETIYKIITYKHGDKTIEVPEVPAKLGYDAAWEKFEIDNTNRTVNAIYTLHEYTAHFVYEDGSPYKDVPFTIESKFDDIKPPVPEKEGYTGAWEDVTLGAEDITIRPVYTLITVDPPETSDTTDVPPSSDTTDVSSSSDTTDVIPPNVSDPSSGCSSFAWWIIVIILFVIIIILVLLLLLKKKMNEAEDDDLPPPPAPTPEPEPVAEEVEEVIPPHFETMEDVTPEQADSIMTDAEAMLVLETLVADTEEASGDADTSDDGYKTFVNIEDISAVFAPHDTVDLESLKTHKLVPEKTTSVKILAKGHLDKPLTVKANKFSVQAIKMIVLTGGKAIIIK